jgi:CTP synthase
VRELMEIGIQPDILICRSEHPISPEMRRKIALFANVDVGAVIEAPDVETIYEVPLQFRASTWTTWSSPSWGSRPKADLAEWRGW